MEHGTLLHLRERDWAYPQTCPTAMLVSFLSVPPPSNQNPVLKVNNTTLTKKRYNNQPVKYDSHFY
jgi:hypothetical protein